MLKAGKKPESDKTQYIITSLFLLAGLIIGFALSSLLFLGTPSLRQLKVLDAGPRGEKVPVTSTIRITFSQEIDPAVVEQSFSIQPKVDGDFLFDENTLVFTPSHPFDGNSLYTITITGMTGINQGSSLSEPFTFSFNTREPRILFLQPSDGQSQIWASGRDMSVEPARQLTHAVGTVLDYSTASDGSFIVFLESDANRGRIWKLDPTTEKEFLLFDCADTSCLYLSLSPDGSTLAFLREPQSASVNHSDEGIWLLDVASGSARLLSQTDVSMSDAPSWSPDGTMIAWSDATAGGIRIKNIQTGQEDILSSSMGLSGSWTPDLTYLFSELQMAGSQPRGVIYRADLEEHTVTRIFPQSQSESSFRVPDCSPDGQWMVAGVEGPETGAGFQLVLYSCTDHDPTLLTNEHGSTFSNTAWHPASGSLLYQRIDNLNPSSVPSIWLHTLESGSSRLVSENAFQPGWLP